MEITKGNAPYEGGVGGKFQKRSFRRAPATPYDRPSSAARVSAPARPSESHAGDVRRGGRWLSKLVDPASRIVAQGASRLFSSFFRKKLTAPPDASELKVKSQEEASNASHIIQNSASEVNEQDLYENNAVNDHASDRALQETCSHVGQTFDLEQLLKQKTFTRFEFDRMMELLRSRTVEPSTSYPPFSSQEINGNVKQHSLIDRRIPESDMTHDNKDKESPGPKLGISFGSHADNTTPVDSLVLMDKNLGEQAGSPAEIAKRYMDSRTSNMSHGILSAQKQVNEEDRVFYNNSQYIKKPFDPSVASRSIYTSATPGLAKNSHMTPRIPGKSATYRMPNSSHFKLPLAAKAGSPSVDQYVWSSSSEWASTGVIKSDDRQTRKRGRLVLDDDTRSFGPVRRLRQKINVTSRYSNSSLKYLSSPLTTSHSYKSPNQKSLIVEDQRQSVVEMNGAENSVVASASIVPIPPQSREMARRILDQLDKIKSSPKGKSSKLKTTDEEESPSKLTYNMLHERALRSMEDIDSSKFLSVEGNNQIEPTSGVHHEVLGSSSDQKQPRPKENGLLEPSVLGVKATAEVHPAKLVINVKSNMKSSQLSVSNGSSLAQKKPSFCISIPEDSLDFDDDDYTTKDSNPAMVEEGKLEVLSDHVSTHSERGKLIKVAEASKIVPMHTPLLETKKDSEKKVSDKPVMPGKDGLMFPTAPTSSSPTQTLPYCISDTISVLSESSAPVKVESGGFKVGFGLKQAQRSSLSSITDDISGPAGVNFVGSASTSVNPLGDLNSGKGDKNVTDGELSKSGNAVVPIFKSLTSSSLSTFTATATSTMSNGTSSLLPGTSTSIVPAMANSGTGAMPDFSTSTTMASSTSSSALTTGFTIPTFQFGSGHPSPATENVVSDSLKTEGRSVKLSASGTGNSIISDISPAFSNAGSDNSAFTSAAVSSTTSTSFSSAPLFCSSSDIGSSSVSASSAPSGSNNSFFGFGTSSQSSGLNISFPSTSSQTTSTPFGFTAGTTFSNQGTQSAGQSHVLQNSVNQIGSLSSPTMFGANGCSSSSSSRSLFASATFAAKPSGSGPEITLSTAAAASSSNSASSTSFTPTAFSSSSGFSFTAPSSSTTAFASTTPFISSSSSSFSFSTGVGSSSGSGSGTSFTAGPTNSTFNSSSQKSPSSIFGSFGSGMSSPSTGSSLGSSASGSPFTFGASSVPTFSFSATGTAVSSMPLQSKPVFGVSNQLPPMNSGSPGNDHMNVEDSMADSPVQAPANTMPTFGTTFGQPSSAPATPSFVFGSPAVNATPSAFHFGSQHGSSIPQNTSPFQPTGSLEFSAGGSFSLGSGAGGGGDKSGRKFVRVRRDKLRKK